MYLASKLVLCLFTVPFIWLFLFLKKSSAIWSCFAMKVAGAYAPSSWVNNLPVPWFSIDHFHKWRPIWYSIVFMLIAPTGLILVNIFFWILRIAARLERIIIIKTKEYFIGPPLWKRSITALRITKHPSWSYSMISCVCRPAAPLIWF